MARDVAERLGADPQRHGRVDQLRGREEAVLQEAGDDEGLDHGARLVDLLERAVANLREKEDRLPTEKRIREEVKAVAGAAMNPYAWPALVSELARLRLDNCFEAGAWFDLARRMEAAGMVYSAAEVRARGNWLIDLAGVGL